MTGKCQKCGFSFEYGVNDIMVSAKYLFGECTYCPKCSNIVELGENIPYGFEHIVSDLKRGLMELTDKIYESDWKSTYDREPIEKRD